MMQLRPFNDPDAWRVFDMLDGWDYAEATAVRGTGASRYGLFADWRAVEGARLISQIAVAERNGRLLPFAVFGLSHTGQAGVAAAALLARDHSLFRRELGELGAAIRAGMPEFCAEQGIARIECRSWTRHPTAGRFLTALGFRHECDMPGFGANGESWFAQYAYTPFLPHIEPEEA